MIARSSRVPRQGRTPQAMGMAVSRHPSIEACFLLNAATPRVKPPEAGHRRWTILLRGLRRNPSSAASSVLVAAARLLNEMRLPATRRSSTKTRAREGGVDGAERSAHARKRPITTSRFRMGAIYAARVIEMRRIAAQTARGRHGEIDHRYGLHRVSRIRRGARAPFSTAGARMKASRRAFPLTTSRPIRPTRRCGRRSEPTTSRRTSSALRARPTRSQAPRRCSPS